MFANLGPALELLRSLRDKSQKRLAQEAGMSKSLLSLYETGGQLPKLESLERILGALQISPFELFSTLEMVDRRAEALEGTPNPFPFLRSGIVPERVLHGFNIMMKNLQTLHEQTHSLAIQALTESPAAEPVSHEGRG
jgi:transcriptional regulator with XRE-family HTH domain